MSTAILGVDIGGTAIKLGLVDGGGHVLAKEQHSVCFDDYKTPILRTALERALSFAESRGVRIDGVGVSATGQIDVHTGVVVGTCGNLPGWVGAPIKAEFESAFKKPVAVMNDADCALMGEVWRGAAEGYRDVVMVTLGTGVGGGVLVGGRILQGRIGLAGEIGHMPLVSGGRPCTCGNAGCYEQYASVTALLRDAGAVLVPQPEDAKQVFDRAANNEYKAMELIDDWRGHIVAGLVGLVHIFNPELILLGGGVSSQTSLLIAPAHKELKSRVMPRFAESFRLKAACLGNDAGFIGAVRNWLDING